MWCARAVLRTNKRPGLRASVSLTLIIMEILFLRGLVVIMAICSPATAMQQSLHFKRDRTTKLLSLSEAASQSKTSVITRAVPTNFWILQRGTDTTMDTEVALCSACCASENAEDLEQSLAALAECDSIAVEIEPICDDSAPAGQPKVAQLSDGSLAEELSGWSQGPRSFLMSGATLARVHEFDFDVGGTGCRVWDAAIALSIHLMRHADVVRSKRCLELGSGVGLCGIVAALAGADQVTLSDLAVEDTSLKLAGGAGTACSTAALLSNLEANAALNTIEATITALDWEDCLQAEESATRPTYPVVIGADLVYEGFAVGALGVALVAHTEPGGVALLMSAKVRWDAASAELLPRLEASGTVECEPMNIYNSHGRTECVLATFRKARGSAEDSTDRRRQLRATQRRR